MIVVIIVAAVVVIANIIVRSRGASWPAFWLKIACGACFVTLGVSGVSHISTVYSPPGEKPLMTLGLSVIVGLGFGLGGDILLALKDMTTGEYNRLLFGGMILFACGHIAYIAGLIRCYHPPFPWLPLAICLVVAVVFVVLDKVLHLNFGVFKWAVAGYAFLVTMLPAMAFFTAATATSSGIVTQPFVMGIAGVCFAISDLILAWTYFGPSRNRPWQHGLCYVFYYAAQFGIAASLFLSTDLIQQRI